jgi:hypothetical protein
MPVEKIRVSAGFWPTKSTVDCENVFLHRTNLIPHCSNFATFNKGHACMSYISRHVLYNKFKIDDQFRVTWLWVISITSEISEMDRFIYFVASLWGIQNYYTTRIYAFLFTPVQQKGSPMVKSFSGVSWIWIEIEGWMKRVLHDQLVNLTFLKETDLWLFRFSHTPEWDNHDNTITFIITTHSKHSLISSHKTSQPRSLRC